MTPALLHSHTESFSARFRLENKIDVEGRKGLYSASSLTDNTTNHSNFTYILLAGWKVLQLDNIHFM